MTLADLPALILAGGLGTRLQSVWAGRPKVLAPVRGRPFIAYWLDELARQGIRQAVLCTGYQADQVQQTLGSTHGPLTLRYSVEAWPRGTAGALAQALPLTETNLVLALNGDSFCRVDLARFLAWHLEKHSTVSLVLTHADDAGRYGRVTTDAHGRVSRFEEKQGGGPGWINAGIYLLDRRVLEPLPADRAVSLEREVLPAWIGRGLMGYPEGGAFIDIGTPESLASAAVFFGSESP